MWGVGKVRGGALHSVWLALKCARNNCCLSWAVGTRGCRGEAFAPQILTELAAKNVPLKKRPCKLLMAPQIYRPSAGPANRY